MLYDYYETYLFPFEELKDITWLNTPKVEGWKLTNVVIYENDLLKVPSVFIKRFHTQGAIFAVVPKWAERNLGA